MWYTYTRLTFANVQGECLHPVLQRGKLRLWGEKYPAQGHTTSKERGQD